MPANLKAGFYRSIDKKSVEQISVCSALWGLRIAHHAVTNIEMSTLRMI